MLDTRVKPLYATDKFISLYNKKPQATVLASYMYSMIDTCAVREIRRNTTALSIYLLATFLVL